MENRIGNKLAYLVENRCNSVVTISLVPFFKLILPKTAECRFVKKTFPISLVGKDAGDIKKCTVVVQQQPDRIEEYPLHARPLAFSPYRLEGHHHLVCYEMPLRFGDIGEGIASEYVFRLRSVPVDAGNGVGDPLGQIAVGVENGKASLVREDLVEQKC